MERGIWKTKKDRKCEKTRANEKRKTDRFKISEEKRNAKRTLDLEQS